MKTPVYTHVFDMDELDALMWEMCQKEPGDVLVITCQQKIRTIKFIRYNRVSKGWEFQLCLYIIPFGHTPNKTNPIIGAHMDYLRYFEIEELIRRIKKETTEEILDSFVWAKTKEK